MLILSVRDIKADNFSPPFLAPNVASGIRSFTDVATNPQSSVNKHPEDFQLFELGDFDERTAAFDLRPQPVFLANATDVVQPSL